MGFEPDQSSEIAPAHFEEALLPVRVKSRNSQVENIYPRFFECGRQPYTLDPVNVRERSPIASPDVGLLHLNHPGQGFARVLLSQGNRIKRANTVGGFLHAEAAASDVAKHEGAR